MTRKAFWAGNAIIVAIALAVRLPHLDSATPSYDEFYHLLAARSWNSEGTLSVASGEYERTPIFTKVVAKSLRVFGDSMGAGRVPALAAGILGVLAVLLWTNRVGGVIAGWSAGLLMALDPTAVNLSQWVRFYTLHGLFVWLGLVGVYHIVVQEDPPKRKLVIGALALASLLLAYQLQPSTLIAIAAVGIWVMGVKAGLLPKWLSDGPRMLRRWLVAGIGLALVALSAWFVASGQAASLWAEYTAEYFWMMGVERSPRFYVWLLGNRYDPLWTLFPAAVIVALARFARPASFAVVIFGIAFLATSFGSAKAERYLYFAMPFFFVTWGLALATLVPALQAATQRALAAVRLPMRPGPVSALSWGLAGLTLIWVAKHNDAFRVTGRMVFPGPEPRPYALADWRPVLPRLRALADSADVVVSSYVLKPLYYLGRGDVHLSFTETAEAGYANGKPVEFSFDSRTGLPAISAPESLERVMNCFSSGLILTEFYHLDEAHLIPRPTASFLRSHTDSIPLPPETRVLAFRWRHELPVSRPACPPWRLTNPSRAESAAARR